VSIHHSIVLVPASQRWFGVSVPGMSDDAVRVAAPLVARASAELTRPPANIQTRTLPGRWGTASTSIEETIMAYSTKSSDNPVTTEHKYFLSLLLTNPNYFGNLADSTLKPFQQIIGNTFGSPTLPTCQPRKVALSGRRARSPGRNRRQTRGRCRRVVSACVGHARVPRIGLAQHAQGRRRPQARAVRSFGTAISEGASRGSTATCSPGPLNR
jgi:hypothetical protein